MKKYREELYRKTVYCPTCRGVTPQGCPRCGEPVAVELEGVPEAPAGKEA